MKYFDIKTRENIGKKFITDSGMIVSVEEDIYLKNCINVIDADDNNVECYHYNNFELVEKFDTIQELEKFIGCEDKDEKNFLMSEISIATDNQQKDTRLTFVMYGEKWDIKIQYESNKVCYYARKIEG